MNNSLSILETTLRDGSYTINYQFNAHDTEMIVGILDDIGFEYIEIGAGVGLNAKKVSKIEPASSDEEYIIHAKKASNKSKIGMFFIPGIGDNEHMKMARDNGLDFVRCGDDISSYENTFKYIEYAKKLGFFVTVNLIKSYAVKANEFANIANDIFKTGADVIYLVDSAGGMLPSEVKSYIEETLEINPQIKLGFHGHNNLDLAVSNSLVAIESGVCFVDTSIRGMGRSSGNASTEKMILILDRMGFNLNIDLKKLFSLSDNVIRPLLRDKTESITDYILGYSQFHSSHLDLVEKVSQEYDLDVNQLIVEYAKFDKITIDEKMLRDIALTVNKKKHYNYNIKSEVNYKVDVNEQILSLKRNFIELKNKYNMKTFFNFSKFYKSNNYKVSPVIHRIENIAFGSAELDNIFQIYDIVDCFGDVIDGYIVDKRLGEVEADKICSTIFYYSDSLLFANAIYNYLYRMISGENQYVYIDIYDEIQEPLKFLINGIDVTVVNQLEESTIALLGASYVDANIIRNCHNLNWILLTVPGSIEKSISDNKLVKNILLIDLANEICSEIIKNINYNILFFEKNGSKIIDGIEYCSGGYIGSKGALVVDNIENIQNIIGVSNGDGSIDYK